VLDDAVDSDALAENVLVCNVETDAITVNDCGCEAVGDTDAVIVLVSEAVAVTLLE
jgi:hypothetical protein